MPRLADLSLRDRAFLAVYRLRRVDPLPSATLAIPITAARVALVSTAGLVPPAVEPFDLARKGGDPSFRVVPGDARPAELELHHRSSSFDAAGIDRDPNLAFPLDRLRELEAQGAIGAVAPRHLSFMGSITAPGRLVRDTAPAARELLVADQVDVALLVPV